ncbi:hypothetical protein ST37_14935 [Vibrio sp. qd031]|uniref:lipocalin-like domain-containing protein n=1 Tax=Vibrio sp. qd031 TaxID=1603038 RepID=UPI000A0FBA03|nr:lipocalin-like domain-containing protein [Vibrio sp. qd031]ORT49653.1 hypothetical protein ST37_14935 [Vibrio sp. qd031]
MGITTTTKKTAFATVMAIAVFLIAFAARYTFVAQQSSESSNTFVNREIDVFRVFEPVLPGKAVKLPDDFNFHLDYQHESSTYFALLHDREGNEYWASWDVFRIALDEHRGKGWKQPQVYVSNAALSTREINLFEQRIARGGIGQVGIETKPFLFWIDSWQWKALTRYPLPGKLTIDTNTFSLDLNSFSVGPYVLEGDQGYRPKHDLLPVASYEFGAPFLNVTGTIGVDGKKIEVSGTGWFSKEWGSNLLESKLLGWDRFGVRLQDGRNLSITLSRINEQLPYVYGVLVDKSGRMIKLGDDDIKIRPIKYSYQNVGKKIPVTWAITIESQQMDIVVDALNYTQWLPSLVPYWSGAVKVTGSHQGGGYMHLMGY